MIKEYEMVKDSTILLDGRIANPGDIFKGDNIDPDKLARLLDRERVRERASKTNETTMVSETPVTKRGKQAKRYVKGGK